MNEVRKYYPSNTTPRCYGIFSPSFDRFLTVDDLDIWMMFETSKILSSKISCVTCVLDLKETNQINKDNCLQYGLRHRQREPIYGGSASSNHKQTPTLLRISHDLISNKGYPQELVDDGQKKMLHELKEYAEFVLICLYSIHIADASRNLWPDLKYLEAFNDKNFPEDFKDRFDGTDAPKGMLEEIKKILYYSNSKDQAIEKINQSWKLYSYYDISGMREIFYNLSGISTPNELLQKDQKDIFNSYTIWVV